MAIANRQIIQGTLFAIVATFFWAFNFIAPYVTGPYSIEDMMLARYVIAGAMGIILLLFYRRQLRGMSLGLRLSGMALGVNGYLLYSICIAGSVICSGPALIAAFVGLVPLLQTVIGNLQSRRLRWKSIAIPMALIVAGLALLNMRAWAAGPSPGHPLLGLAFAFGAVGSWLSFSVFNQKAVANLEPATTQAWTCLMMIGAGIGAVVLLPLVVGAGKALVREPDLLSAPVLLFYAWALIIAFSSSVLGAGAWNAATRRLPMVLSGQFVALESLFATVLGYAFLGQWPGTLEIVGMLLVVLGAARSLHIILASKDADVSSPALLEEIAHEYDR